MVELLDRLLGGEGGDDRHRFEPVAVVGVDLRVVRVQSSGDRAPHLFVGHREHREPEARIEQQEVEPELLRAAVRERRQRDGHAVEGVLLGKTPEDAGGHEPRVVGRERAPHELLVAIGHAVSRHFADDVVHEREELEEVPVGVDHRMVEPGSDPSHLV